VNVEITQGFLNKLFIYFIFIIMISFSGHDSCA